MKTPHDWSRERDVSEACARDIQDNALDCASGAVLRTAANIRETNVNLEQAEIVIWECMCAIRALRSKAPELDARYPVPPPRRGPDGAMGSPYPSASYCPRSGGEHAFTRVDAWPRDRPDECVRCGRQRT